MMTKNEYMGLPDIVYGLGGAGKSLVFSLLESGWFIKRILKSQRRIKFIIVDSATEEIRDDLEKINKINEHIRKLSEKLGKANTISIDYKCITENINVRTPAHLYTNELINLAHENGLIWWIYDDKYGVNIKTEVGRVVRDFAGGTIRRRSLTKAMFYKAKLYGKLGNIFDIRGEKIAIICGLGGGTGSGTFMDLAKFIKEYNPHTNIVLFGILPSLQEDREEKTNAYIALSEIERTYLDVMDIFSYIILMHIEPTQYKGNVTPEVNEFNELFPYIFVAACRDIAGVGCGDINIGPGNRKYGIFVLSTGGIIRYNVNSVIKMQKDLEESISKLVNVENLESRIRDQIDNVINKLKEESLIALDGKNLVLYKKQKGPIIDRLSKFYNFIRDDILNKTFEYSVPSSIYDEICSNIPEFENGELFLKKLENIEEISEFEELLDLMRKGIENVTTSKAKDLVDSKIKDVALIELDNIHKLLRQLGDIRKFKVSDELKDILGDYEIDMSNIFSEFVLFNITSAKIGRLEDINRSIHNELIKIKNDMQELENKSSDIDKITLNYENNINNIIKSVEDELRFIYEVEKKRELIKNKIKGLNEEISLMLQNLENELKNESPDENRVAQILGSLIREISSIKNILREDLASNLPEKYKDNLEDLRRLMDRINICFSILKDAAENYCLYKNNKPGLLRRIFKMGHNELEEYEENFERASEELFTNYSDIVEYNYLPENVIINTLRLNMDIESEIIKHIGKIVEPYENKFISKIRDEFGHKNIKINFTKKALDSSDEFDFINKLKEDILDQIFALEGLSDEKKRVGKDIEILNIKYEKYQRTFNLLNEILKDIRVIMRDIKEYKSKLNEYNEKIEKLKNEIKKNKKLIEEGCYINIVEPTNDVLGLIYQDKGVNLANIIDKNIESIKNERGRLVNAVGEMLEKLNQTKYRGVKRLEYLTRHDPPEEYLVENPVVYVLSPSKTLNEEIYRKILDMKDNIFGNLLEPRIFNVTMSGDFDIAVVLFYPCTFLENIYGVYGDHSSYYRMYKQLDDRQKLLHHILALEEGWYVHREKIPENEAFYLAILENPNKYGQDISETISNNYSKIKKYIDNTNFENKKSD